VYEDTTGLEPGAPVWGTGLPLHVELGPGLLGSIFDGIQRPLQVLRERTGDFVRRGAATRALDTERRWDFEPPPQRASASAAAAWASCRGNLRASHP
jgi:V/A-type H+-transporting ATPase subunit A